MADVVFGHPHEQPPRPSVHRRLRPLRRMDIDDDDDDDGLATMLANINLNNTTTTDDHYDYKEYLKKKKTRFHDPLSEKKLVLVLDLDRTLLHTTLLSQLSHDENQAYLLDQGHHHDLFTWESSFQPLMTTKLRPFVHEFLNKASHLFDMYIYTLGSRTYAEGIAKILDPHGLYFGGDSSKLISRDDTIRLVGGHRKTLSAVPRDERTVVIIDDMEEVWYGHLENLIHIQGYDYFDSSYSSEDQAGAALATILDVLQDAHHQFFDPRSCNIDISSRDVRLVLRSIRQKILQGCGIVFSWVLPSNYINDGQAEKKPIWKMAQELGATCSMNQEILLAGGSAAASVTHVVSSSIGTKAAQWAVQNNKFLVTTLWVEAAYYSWRRPREDDFLLYMLMSS